MDKIKIIALTGLVSIIGFAYLRGNLTYHPNSTPAALYPQVVQKADSNRDNNVTENEWLEVYKSLDKSYDAKKPAELNVEEMRKYLNITE